MSDRDLFYHMGLFFIENWPMDSGNHRHHSPNSVSDGLSQTLMLSENVRAGYDAGHDTTWAAPGPLWSSFVLSGYICDNAICSTGHVHYANANSRSGGPWSHEAINSGLSAAEGTAPWPNSFHPGGVHDAFADGHVKFLSDIPITLSPDGRDRPPHLRSFRDGWRHLRFMLICSPMFLFVLPGIMITIAALGLIPAAVVAGYGSFRGPSVRISCTRPRCWPFAGFNSWCSACLRASIAGRPIPFTENHGRTAWLGGFQWSAG